MLSKAFHFWYYLKESWKIGSGEANLVSFSKQILQIDAFENHYYFNFKIEEAYYLPSKFKGV